MNFRIDPISRKRGRRILRALNPNVCWHFHQNWFQHNSK